MICEGCREEMILVAEFKATNKRKYNLKRFHCQWCDVIESSTIGDRWQNNSAISEVDSLYKQQEEYND